MKEKKTFSTYYPTFCIRLKKIIFFSTFNLTENIKFIAVTDFSRILLNILISICRYFEKQAHPYQVRFFSRFIQKRNWIGQMRFITNLTQTIFHCIYGKETEMPLMKFSSILCPSNIESVKTKASFLFFCQP